MPTAKQQPTSAAVAGEAAAAQADVVNADEAVDPTSAAFFDIDNTVVRGASIYHMARGLYARHFFTTRDAVRFAWHQIKFRVQGREDLDDIASSIGSALGFVAGHSVEEVTALGREVFEERISDRLYADTVALASAHEAKGRRVWLVSAAPIELSSLMADELGLTGALGTVSEIVDGVYTGRLEGEALHGQAKAEAVAALARREGLDLAECWAYTDSFNDIPLLSLVGHPVAVNPDRRLRRLARERGWAIHDYRTARKAAAIGVPTAVGLGVAAGVVGGVIAGQRRRHRRRR